MIRDKFVFGLVDDNLKERLLRETAILLDKMVTLAQRTESSKQQAKEMRMSSMKTIDAIAENKPKEFFCGRCGHNHRPKECPAYDQQCSACHKLHHFAKVCRNKQLLNTSKSSKPPNTSNPRRKVHTVQKDDTSSDSVVNHKYLCMLYKSMGSQAPPGFLQCLQNVEKLCANLIQVLRLVSFR